jgi:AcrR family transcriptional regulator
MPAANSSAHAILAATRELIDAGGVESLTLRRLAVRCGIGTTTLYGYFRSKDELLGALADQLFEEITLPPEGLRPFERIRALMASIYRVMVAYPELAQIIAERPTPGATAPNLLRVIVRAFDEAGLDARQTQVAHDVLAAYTNGFVLREAARSARAPQLAELIAEIHEPGPVAASDETRGFMEGLDVILDGVATWSAASAGDGSWPV